jgi:hypothetical protein
MNDQYKPIYKQAARLQHDFHDFTHHTAHDPMASVLRKEIHELTNDLAVGKNATTIESRVKNIQRQMHQTQLRANSNPHASTPILNTHQFVSLNQNFEHMRQNIHQIR